jgi:ABC-type iron transport system FetAB ATPase subunit
MEAIENKQDEFSFKFPYRIRNKYSKQCIALELLGREMFPDRLIQSAIEMKNRISKNIVNDINKQYIK